jgi:hypothetical protein
LPLEHFATLYFAWRVSNALLIKGSKPMPVANEPVPLPYALRREARLMTATGSNAKD